jgi:type IV secretory pathway TraG/TraD family ATPase VirD4
MEMGAGRIYWGQIIAVLGVMMCGAQAATQWTAARLAYQPALGAPDFFLFGIANKGRHESRRFFRNDCSCW